MQPPGDRHRLIDRRVGVLGQTEDYDWMPVGGAFEMPPRVDVGRYKSILVHRARA
jgi:hypothetical protein